MHGVGEGVLDGEGEELALADSAADGEPVEEGAALHEGLAVEDAEGRVEAEPASLGEEEGDTVGA